MENLNNTQYFTVQKETDRSVVISTVGHVNMVYATEKIHVIP